MVPVVDFIQRGRYRWGETERERVEKLSCQEGRLIMRREFCSTCSEQHALPIGFSSSFSNTFFYFAGKTRGRR
jgi:hypothetical protein